MKKSLLLLVLMLASCGWEPLYVSRENKDGWNYFGGRFDTSITSEMTQVRVESISGRFGQQIRNNLLDSLTPKGVPSEPKYRLHVTPMEKRVTQQALRDDITATRERVKYKVLYQMTDDSGELFDGNSIAYVSYDILNNPYSTTVAAKKAETDAAKIIADDIALRVGAYFHTKLKGNE